ncbi:hypothetical protein [Xanthomonas tesorieronis]|uniref:hypothetical protein n=1 Tax=Xanthomonas tesorieronis TaxID=3160839 RepID=UPI00351261B0
MTEENPYQAPATRSAATPADRRWRIAVLPFVCIQALLAALYAPIALEKFRNGEISAIDLLLWLLANVALVFGGFRLLRNPRKASYLFATSSLLAVAAYLQWRPRFVLIGLVIAVLPA